MVQWLAITKQERDGSSQDVSETRMGVKLEVGLVPRSFCLISNESLNTFLMNSGGAHQQTLAPSGFTMPEDFYLRRSFFPSDFMLFMYLRPHSHCHQLDCIPVSAVNGNQYFAAQEMSFLSTIVLELDAHAHS